MTVNKETLQIEVLSNIDKVLKGLNDSSKYIKDMSNGAVKVDEKFDQLQTSLKEINTILKQIGSGTIFDQLIGAQTRLNAAQKRTVEQYKAIDAAQRYTRATNVSKLDDEKLSYTIKGQTLKLYAAERALLENNNKTHQKAVDFERGKLDNLNKEFQRRKDLETQQRKAEQDAQRASKKALADSEKLTRQEEAAAKKAQALAQKAATPYSSKTDVIRMNAKASDPNYMDAQRNMRLQAALGDGGAGLFKIQAGLLANYTLMNTFFSTLSFAKEFVMELDNSLMDLQAITATTTGNMEGLRQKIIEVSQGTKFTAVEVANAAKIMGQAGFSTQQIQDSIQGVTLLATATGSSLEEAADTATSVISVFQLRAEDMTHVANVMTEAINKSKLTMDKLALGIQYAGNIASESGLSFEETTAILGAMSNAGIKSGSTLGTGLRQVLIELQNPTEKFKKNLQSVGLSIDDVDVKSKGFVGVLNTLKTAGFNTAKAFESFEVRSAAAFAAMQNDPELITALEQSMLHSNAAVEANNIQMESLSNKAAVLRGNLGLLINDFSGPFISVIKQVTDILSWLTTTLRAVPGLLDLVGTAIISLGVVFAGSKLVLLITNLGKSLMIFDKVALAFNMIRLAASGGILSFGLFGSAIASALGPLTAITLVLTAAAYTFGIFSDRNEKAKDGIEALKTSLENSNTAYAKTTETIDTLEGSLTKLTDRFSHLKESPAEVRLEVSRLNQQFGQLGLDIKNGVNATIYDLIEALQKLRGELKQTAAEQLKANMAQQSVLFSEQIKQTAEKAKNTSRFKNGNNPLLNNTNSILTDTENLGSLYLAPDASSKDIQLVQDKLEKVQFRVSTQIGSLNKALSEFDKIESAGNKLSADQGITRKLIKLDLEKLAGIYTDLQNSISTVSAKNFSTQASEKVAIEASDAALAVDKTISDYREKLSEYKTKLADDKSDSNKEQIIKEIEQSIKNLKGDARNAAIDAIIQELEDISLFFGEGVISGINLDSMEADVASATEPAMASIINDLNDLKDKTATNLADSAKKSSTAFNTAMQLAKDGFDVVKETYDDIGRKFDARIKSYQDIVDANSNSYSGTYGQYSDAEIEAIKKRQYQEKINATKSRLDALPSVISNLDGVISKQSKAPIALDENGNAIRSSVQGNKQLNDLIKQKNTLVAEQNALQAEYNAMVGLSTEAHMTFGQQIKATIDDYAKVEMAQSSFTANIRDNLITTFDSAKSSFSDMVYGFVSGSQTAGDSVRSFAKGVLESMLKIASNNLASTVLGYGLKALGSYMGSSNSFTGSYTTANGLTYTSATGGFVNMASGGANPNRDSVPALLRPGEFVMRNQAVEAIGRGNLETINALGARTISQSGELTNANNNSNSGGTTMMNVYVISPDQKPSLTKNDVIVTIADDLNRGGPIKKLIKSVVVN